MKFTIARKDGFSSQKQNRVNLHSPKVPAQALKRSSLPYSVGSLRKSPRIAGKRLRTLSAEEIVQSASTQTHSQRLKMLMDAQVFHNQSSAIVKITQTIEFGSVIWCSVEPIEGKAENTVLFRDNLYNNSPCSIKVGDVVNIYSMVNWTWKSKPMDLCLRWKIVL